MKELTQVELIEVYKTLVAGSDACSADPYRNTRYEYVLLTLRKLIESYGPTEEYYAVFG